MHDLDEFRNIVSTERHHALTCIRSPCDRFTYWVMRVARGGEVMAPGRPDRHIQFIDAHDLAEWIVHMVERQETGVYNANGLPGALTMKSVLDECKNVSGSDASFTWVSDEFLTQENVTMWTEMPLWLPESNADTKGFFSISIGKAISSGLRFRPVSDTIGGILTWRKANGLHEALKAGINPAKEQDLLREWHSMQQQHNAPRPLPRLVSER